LSLIEASLGKTGKRKILDGDGGTCSRIAVLNSGNDRQTHVRRSSPHIVNGALIDRRQGLCVDGMFVVVMVDFRPGVV